MSQGLTSYIDVAQVCLYAFWLFFAGLVFYLHRENKREGYPLETERSATARVSVRGFPDVPLPKVFKSHDGGIFTAPDYSHDRADAPVTASSVAPGSPFVPVGDPMAGGVGPASYAARADVPEIGANGEPIMVPLRRAPGHSVAPEGPNPVGMSVVGCDGGVAGTVTDVWIDEAESLIRYLEVETVAGNRLLPMNVAKVHGRKGIIKVVAITAAQFAGVPVTKVPDQVTKLEEDKIMAYFAGGYLYATPLRRGG